MNQQKLTLPLLSYIFFNNFFYYIVFFYFFAGCGHPCRELCYEPCGRCHYFGPLTLPCGHETRGSCATTAICRAVCERRRPDCGHPCRGACSRPCDSVRCEELVAAGTAGAPSGRDAKLCAHRKRDEDDAMVPCYRVAQGGGGNIADRR